MMDARLVGRVLDAARTVNPLLSVSASALDLHQPPTSGSVRAQVAARLADGSYRVLIDGKALRLALPANIRPGDVLQLRVVDRAGHDAGMSGTAMPAAGKGVSSAGQLVADLVQQPAAAPARQNLPVLDAPPEHPEVLPEPLARAVERSGLFYESHQARWVNGEFPLERLLQEPQADALNPAAIDAADEDAASAPAALVGAHAAVTDLDEGDAIAPKSQTAMAQEAAPEIAEKAGEIAARETLNIVRQQIEALETRHFQWLGDIWPGQTMRWEIGAGPDERPGRDDAAHEWDSRFALDLPMLGNIGAELVLSGNRLRIRLSAKDEASVAAMRGASHELMLALQAGGIEPAAFEVQQRDPEF